MAYDQAMAARIRAELSGTPGLTEKKMFGGVTWSVNGHLAVGAYRDGRLMIRCGSGQYREYMAEVGTGPMLRAGKPMSGWVLIDADAVDSDEALARWVGRGRAHAQAQVPK